MNETLKNLTVAVTGDFGSSRGHDKIKQCIMRHGGTFTLEITPRVTHLVCSKDHYKKGVEMVEQARALKTIRIVSFDWLEDSLMLESVSAKGEEAYLIGPHVRKESATRKKKNRIRRENIQEGYAKEIMKRVALWGEDNIPAFANHPVIVRTFERSCEEHENNMKSSGYSLYFDPHDGFAFNVTLARANLLVNKNERYLLKVCHTSLPQAQAPTSSPTSTPVSPPTPSQPPAISTPIFPFLPPSARARARLVAPRAQRLQLFASHDVPKQYACSVKYSTPGAQAQWHVLAPSGSSWELAWGAFSSFFKLKTGKEWAIRFAMVKDIEIMEDGKRVKAFVYTPPDKDEPWGVTSGRLGMNQEGRLDITYGSPFDPLPPMSQPVGLLPSRTQPPLEPYGGTVQSEPLLPSLPSLPSLPEPYTPTLMPMNQGEPLLPPPPLESEPYTPTPMPMNQGELLLPPLPLQPEPYTPTLMPTNRKLFGFKCRKRRVHILSEDGTRCVGRWVCTCGYRYGYPLGMGTTIPEYEKLGDGEVETFLNISKPDGRDGRGWERAGFQREE